MKDRYNRTRSLEAGEAGIRGRGDGRRSETESEDEVMGEGVRQISEDEAMGGVRDRSEDEAMGGVRDRSEEGVMRGGVRDRSEDEVMGGVRGLRDRYL